jgi:hypothetical protein
VQPTLQIVSQTNNHSGISQIIGSPIAFGLSYVNGPPNGPLYVYQALFLLVGLLTVVTAPCKSAFILLLAPKQLYARRPSDTAQKRSSEELTGSYLLLPRQQPGRRAFPE